MKEQGIRKGLKLYRTVITRNIVLFMAVGLLNIFFADSGFFPDARMQQMAQLLYGTALPLIAGYLVGKEWGDDIGGMAGVIAVSGLLLSDCSAVLVGAILTASLAGWAVSRGYEQFRDHVPAAGTMLGRNLWIVAVGCAGAWMGSFLVVPVLNVVSRYILWAIEYLQQNQMMFLSSILVEPVKLLYLNNDLNHGLLIPLGMEQVQQTGSSMLFLLETNPGPGLGVLLAVLLSERERKKEMASAILAQTVGGIHEVYFPVVLADLRLTAALIAGGMAGTAWCTAFHAGLAGPVSPGSILTILLMTEPGQWLGVLGAVLLAAAVSCVVAMLILRMPVRGEDVKDEKEAVMEERMEERMEEQAKEQTKETCQSQESLGQKHISCDQITHIYVVCAAGLGSSAMGASLLRRTIKKMGLDGIQAAAAPADQVPEDAQLILCQKEYVRLLPEMSASILPVENLMNQQEYERILEMLKERGQIG